MDPFDEYIGQAKSIAGSMSCEQLGFIYQYSNSCVRNEPFSGKYPISLLVNNDAYGLDGRWQNVLVKTIDVLDAIDRNKLIESVSNFSASYFSMTDEGMRNPYRHVASGVCIDRSLASTNCVYYSRKLFQMCNIDLSSIRILYVDKDKDFKGNIGSPRHKVVPDDEGMAATLQEDIRANYNTGFDFSESSKRIVEERTGCLFSNRTIRVIQSHMFKRKDGLWFFEDQIGGAELRSEIVAQCEHWLAENPIANLTRFVDLLGSRVANIEDDFDKGKYIEYVVKKSNFGKVCDFNGNRGGRICFRADIGVEAAKRAFADKVESLLRDRFDLVPVSELADLFPMVSADWMVDNLPKLLPNAILEDMGDRSFAFKLLEYYYLPEDFPDAFHAVTDELVADNEVLSVTRILSALSDRYGYDLRNNFGLSETAFKQIASHVDRKHRSWSGAIFGGADDGGNERFTFKQIVEKQFPRVFSHEEFYKFGAMAWGWGEEHRAWHHKQLWNSFIRYDAEHWSPVEYFKNATGWSEEIEKEMSEALRELLGTNPFFSMNKVPQQFLDKLPDLHLEGRPVHWTFELLASVVFFCLPQVRVINHAAAPYTVTSLLVPSDVSEDTDGVAYMVRVFKLRNPYAPGGDYSDTAYQNMALEFLFENDVRLKASQKLQAEVSELLKREDI